MLSLPGCRALKRLLERRKGVILAHHWDADGVASAALLERVAGLVSPRVEVIPIGEYSWRALPLPEIGELLVAVDYGIPGREYDELVEVLEEDSLLGVVDHHLVEAPRKLEAYCNPVALRLGGEGDYPATSYVVYKLYADANLGREERFLAALGIAGDLSAFIDAGKSHKGLEEARSLVKGLGVSLEELKELAVKINSCYYLLDSDCLKRAVEKASQNPLQLLGDPELEEKKIGLSKTLDEALKSARVVREEDRYAVSLLDYDAYVTSAVGKSLASGKPEKIVALVHRIAKLDRARLYIRSLSLDLGCVRRGLAERGLEPRGKEKVIVVERRGSEVNKLVAEVEAVLEECSHAVS